MSAFSGQALYGDAADAAATAAGIPTELFDALIGAESSWTPGEISPTGAIGLTQLEPGTASDLGVDPYNINENLQGGATYLSQMFQRFGNWRDALAAYNAGPGNLKAGYGYADSVLAAAGVSSNMNRYGTPTNPNQPFVASPSTAVVPSSGFSLDNFLYGTNGTGNVVNDFMAKLWGAPAAIGNAVSNPLGAMNAAQNVLQTGSETTQAPNNLTNINPQAAIAFLQQYAVDIAVAVIVLLFLILGVKSFMPTSAPIQVQPHAG